VSFLVDYAKVAVGSSLLIIVGVVLLLIGNSIIVPGQYKTFLGIPYETNPEYALTLIEKLFLMIAGIILVVSSPLYAVTEMASSRFRASRPQPPTNRSSIPPPPPAMSHSRYCIHCGAENPFEASFCHKCGEKLVES
jgi:hypothetical protein